MSNALKGGAWVLLMALLPVTAQAQPGVLRRMARGAATNAMPIGLDKEREIGREVAATVLGRWHALNDPALTEYVTTVGTIVAQQSPRWGEVPFRFAVLDTDDINAFATPGGYIFVTRGALNAMESEAELAGVLAHEVGHVDQKHVLSQIQKMNMVTGATSEADLAGPIMNEVIGRLTSLLFMGVGREAELESDSIGQVYAARAGYRPDGLITFLRRTAVDTPAQRSRLAESRASHPPDADRIAALTRQMTSEQLDPNSGQLLADRYRQNVRRR
jgi:predicted Zn-dependent protease